MQPVSGDLGVSSSAQILTVALLRDSEKLHSASLLYKPVDEKRPTVSLSKNVTYIEITIDVPPHIKLSKSVNKIIEILQLNFNALSIRIKIRRVTNCGPYNQTS